MTSSITKQLFVHPATDLFASLTDLEYEALKESIRAAGQQHPILVIDDKIVDGRARYRACLELGIEPKFDFAKSGPVSPLELVIAHNLQRRHLSEGQRAMIAARICTSRLGDNQNSRGTISQGVAAARLGVSIDSLQRAQKVLTCGVPDLVAKVEKGLLDLSSAASLAVLDREEVESVLVKDDAEIQRHAKILRKAKKEAKRRERVAQIESAVKNSKPLSPDGKQYGVIYADPPWDYLGEEVPYPTMSLESICEMPVAKRVTDDAVLFLWVPASLLADGLKVVEAWGFEYKTHAVWDKERTGTGMYFQSQHELLMLATRGNLPEVRLGRRPGSIFREKRTAEHSRKPRTAYQLIEGMYPELTKLELFCRGEPEPGWDGFGNECVVDQAAVEQEQPAGLIAATTDEVGALAESANDGQAKLAA